MEPVKFLIFDENSTIGSRLLGKIYTRCKEGKRLISTEVFGGMFIFILGGIKQLPSVMDVVRKEAKGTSSIWKSCVPFML